jgi:hypothetical protein
MKKVAGEVMGAIEAFGVKYKTRGELVQIVRARLILMDLEPAAKRLIGDHTLSLFGYGGGM